jgi:hypothetical protein
MGAIAVSIFVTVVAVIGVIYFNRQDKKELHQANKA